MSNTAVCVPRLPMFDTTMSLAKPAAAGFLLRFRLTCASMRWTICEADTSWLKVLDPPSEMSPAVEPRLKV